MRRPTIVGAGILCFVILAARPAAGQEWWKPYSPPCTERENVFAFTQQPVAKLVGKDKYEITFAVEGYCDVTVGIIDKKGKVVRHLGSGVLGKNAPPPFQKDSLKQTLYWGGKDDLDVYVKEPGKLKVRVMLGLKPEFDRRLGCTSPYSLPGYVLGICVDQSGAYVFTRGQGAHNVVHLRKYDHDARYVATLSPPPADLPWEKHAGRCFIEYEPGRRAVHGPRLAEGLAYNGNWLPMLSGRSVVDMQPAVVNGRIYFCNSSRHHQGPSRFFWVGTDGSTEVNGRLGRRLLPWDLDNQRPRMAASPDGRWLYLIDWSGRHRAFRQTVVRCLTDGSKPAEIIVGNARFNPGSDNKSLNRPAGIATDAKGRIYVADHNNNRVQVYDPDGAFLKTIKIDRPHVVCVHQKTGAIYVQHRARYKGKTLSRLTKLRPFADPTEVYHVDHVETAAMALDSWAPTPRLWLAGGVHRGGSTTDSFYVDKGPGVSVWEETGNTLRKIVDFDEAARKAAGKEYTGRWSGGVFDHVDCDPVREHVYYQNKYVYDLKTGKLLRTLRLQPTGGGSLTDNIDFCKRGYLHYHRTGTVVRMDPGQPAPYRDWRGHVKKGLTTYPETPYDYGVVRRQAKGALPVKDQGGAKGFQDGLGVNMRGDVAVQSNIYHIPRMGDDSFRAAFAGRLARGNFDSRLMKGAYAGYMRKIQEMEKRGETLYSLPRRPGQPLNGATIWTYDRSGELAKRCAALTGGVMAGSKIDEDGFLYFTVLGNKMVHSKPFLAGRAGRIGYEGKTEPDRKYRTRTPWTGTFMRTAQGSRWLLEKPKVKLDELPKRPLDLYACRGSGHKLRTWVEGAQWTYAGTGPLSSGGCTCPSMRSHVDWYKRSYVPEAYRHSIGVLDSNGNLILHIGRYGNIDSGDGARSRIPVGGDHIGLTLPRFISGTDNYLCFDDHGERLTVLKLDYHAAKTAPVGAPAGEALE